MSDHRDDTALDVTPVEGAGSDDRQEARAAFAERLADIESLPLESRASAFGEVHDDLRAVLEGTSGDVGPRGR